jgi:hypothetical protein
LNRYPAHQKRHYAPDGDAEAVRLQFEILLSRIELLQNGEGPTEYPEMMRLRERLPELLARHALPGRRLLGSAHVLDDALRAAAAGTVAVRDDAAEAAALRTVPL